MNKDSSVCRSQSVKLTQGFREICKCNKDQWQIWGLSNLNNVNYHWHCKPNGNGDLFTVFNEEFCFNSLGKVVYVTTLHQGNDLLDSSYPSCPYILIAYILWSVFAHCHWGHCLLYLPALDQMIVLHDLCKILLMLIFYFSALQINCLIFCFRWVSDNQIVRGCKLL